MSKFYIPSKGPEDWKQFFAEPDIQWKSCYSAKTLAYCWEKADGFPKSIKKFFPIIHNLHRKKKRILLENSNLKWHYSWG